MKYNETGFRPFYHHFCVIPLSEEMRSVLKGFPGETMADGVLTYGYIDPEQGLCLEVIAAAKILGEDARFAPTNDQVKRMISIEAVTDSECLYFGDEDEHLTGCYGEKLRSLRRYDADEAVEKTREMAFLDECRDRKNIDVVTVYLTKDGLEPELCRVRISGMEENRISGVLLDEPKQPFGWHQWETVAFYLHQTEDNKIICEADLNPAFPVTEAALSDGLLLKQSIEMYADDQSEENFIRILSFLRDSKVWIPCKIKLTDREKKNYTINVENGKTDFDSLIADPSASIDSGRLIPDIFSDGKKDYFPVFSKPEAMGNVEGQYSPVCKSFTDVINMARKNKKKIFGIVVDPFDEHPFVLKKTMWKIIEQMRSNII